MSYLEKLKATLKDRWLDYYQVNCFWLKNLSDKIQTPDKGTRPSAFLILGAISVLEPSLRELLLPFSQLNPDSNKLVDLLGLNFDPSLELEKRSAEAAATQNAEIIPLLTDADAEYLNKLREENSLQ